LTIATTMYKMLRKYAKVEKHCWDEIENLRSEKPQTNSEIGLKGGGM
jgi:hypothetical protein